MMPEAESDVCIPSLCFHERLFSSKFGDNVSLVRMSWRLKFIGRYKNITLKMSLWPGNKSGVLISISKKVSPGGNQALITFKQFCKKAASHVTLSFLFCIDRCQVKNVQPLLLFFAGDSFLYSLCTLV